MTRIDLDQIEQDATQATPGPYEWSDCFDEDSDNCGELMVRIPSKRAWDAHHGWYYLDIADMEWATGEDMHTAAHIANCDPQTVLALVRAVRAAVAYERATWASPYDDRAADRAKWDRVCAEWLDALAPFMTKEAS